jgi:precorrin-6B methylase 2
MLKKILKAGDDRRSRFHTEDNVFIGWQSVLSQTPVVTVQKIRSKVTGSRPNAPWWPLPVIKEVDKRLTSRTRAIEFGSGSSSIWIAKRVASLICREHSEYWASITRKRIDAEGLKNCEVESFSGKAYYTLDPYDKFDFAVVDGEYRWKCLEALADKINQGGFIYFDNSDSDKDAHHYDEFGVIEIRKAQAVAQEVARSKNARLEEIHGMIHGEIYAGSGTLITFP